MLCRVIHFITTLILGEDKPLKIQVSDIDTDPRYQCPTLTEDDLEKMMALNRQMNGGYIN